MLARSLSLLLGAAALLAASPALAQDPPEFGPPVGIPASAPAGAAGPGPQAPQGPMQMMSPALVGVGGAFLGLGVFGMTGGAISFGITGKTEINVANARTPSVAVLLAGAGCIVVGLPLVLIGAQRVPAQTAARPKAGPWVALGPASVAVGARF